MKNKKCEIKLRVCPPWVTGLGVLNINLSLRVIVGEAKAWVRIWMAA